MFGGGMTIENAGFDDFASASKIAIARSSAHTTSARPIWDRKFSGAPPFRLQSSEAGARLQPVEHDIRAR